MIWPRSCRPHLPSHGNFPGKHTCCVSRPAIRRHCLRCSMKPAPWCSPSRCESWASAPMPKRSLSMSTPKSGEPPPNTTRTAAQSGFGSACLHALALSITSDRGARKSLRQTSHPQPIPRLIPKISRRTPNCAAFVRQALEILPCEQRRAIEIARQLNEPVGAIKTRVRLGLMKLRRLLAPAQ